MQKLPVDEAVAVLQYAEAPGQSEVVTLVSESVVIVHSAQTPVSALQTPSRPEPSALDLQVLASAVHPVVAAHKPSVHDVLTFTQLSTSATGTDEAPVQVSAKQTDVVALQ